MISKGSIVYTTSAVIMLSGNLPKYPHILFKCKVLEKNSGSTKLYVVESTETPARQLLRYEDELLTDKQLNNLRGEILATKINI